MSMNYRERSRLETRQQTELEAIGWVIKCNSHYLNRKPYELYDHNQKLVEVGTSRSAVYFLARKAIRQRKTEVEKTSKLQRWNNSVQGGEL